MKRLESRNSSLNLGGMQVESWGLSVLAQQSVHQAALPSSKGEFAHFQCLIVAQHPHDTQNKSCPFPCIQQEIEAAEVNCNSKVNIFFRRVPTFLSKWTSFTLCQFHSQYKTFITKYFRHLEKHRFTATYGLATQNFKMFTFSLFM